MIDAARRLAFKMVRYGGLGALARPLVGGVGAILMLHRVTASREAADGPNRGLAITPQFLDLLIGEMKRMGWSFVSMDEAVARLRSGSSRGLFSAITADDGYRDNLTEALPVLESHSAPITIYVAPGLTSGDIDLWWEVLEGLVAAERPFTVKLADGKMRFDCSTPKGRTQATGSSRTISPARWPKRTRPRCCADGWRWPAMMPRHRAASC